MNIRNCCDTHWLPLSQFTIPPGVLNFSLPTPVQAQTSRAPELAMESVLTALDEIKSSVEELRKELHRAMTEQRAEFKQDMAQQRADFMHALASQKADFVHALACQKTDFEQALTAEKTNFLYALSEHRAWQDATNQNLWTEIRLLRKQQEATNRWLVGLILANILGFASLITKLY